MVVVHHTSKAHVERLARRAILEGAAMIALRAAALVAIAAVALGAVSPVAAADAEPKSNIFARAKVLSKNELSITIRHSDWGQKAAYQFAADHCASFGKVAVQTSSGMGYGPDTTTTWLCEAVPSVAQPGIATPPAQ